MSPLHSHRRSWLAAGLALALLLPAANSARGQALPGAPADEPGYAPGRLIVKLRSEGPRAVKECAEKLSREGRSFRDATADRSDSLDRVRERAKVRSMRALFRRPDGRSLDEQRSRLRQRIEAQKSRRPARAHSVRRGRPPAQTPDLSHVYEVTLEEGIEVHEAIALYRDDPHVEYAQPDYVVEADYVPNDPFFHSSGSWFQSEADLWGLHKIEAEAAWDISRGEGVVVAVTDTGLDYTHPDIVDNLWMNPGEDLNGNGVLDEFDINGIDDDENGYIDDFYGFDWANSVDANGDQDFNDRFDIPDNDPMDDNFHGTHVSGTIVATGDNGIGIIGVAPGARVMALKGLNRNGSGLVRRLGQAIVYAALNGAQVINNSWSCSSRCPQNPLVEDAVRFADSLGVVQVFAAGNDQDDASHRSPQNMVETIVVGASTPSDKLASFSNFGLLMDVVAPGGADVGGSNILSLKSREAKPQLEPLTIQEQYVRGQGTSFAAPHVTGLVALIFAVNPDLSPDDVRGILRFTADDLGRSGHDATYGSGRINARRALEEAVSPGVIGRITAPVTGELIRHSVGTYEVRGTAAGDDFDHFQVYWAARRAPTSWRELGEPQYAPVEDGTLGVWEVADRAQGSFTLRLVVTNRSGRSLEQFAIVSLERIEPVLLSSPGHAAYNPDLSGGAMVWERIPAGGTQEDIYLTRLGDRSIHVISTEPGRQYQPRIGGNLIAWIEGSLVAHDVLACSYSPLDMSCPSSIVVPSSYRPKTHEVSNDWLGWTAPEGSVPYLFVCEWPEAGAGCGPSNSIAQSAIRFDFEAGQLTWSSSELFNDAWSCRLDPETGECPAAAVESDAPGQRHLPNGAGDLFSFESSAENPTLYICQRDPETGECPAVQVARNIDFPSSDLSGNRLVWQMKRRDDDDDIHYCEFDRLRQECPVQRLTGDASVQSNASTDGQWVVWQDLRSGVSEIFGLEVPGLAPIGDRVGAEGVELRIPITGIGAADRPIALSAYRIAEEGAPTLEELGAQVFDFGDRTGELVWMPDYDQAGAYVVSVEGTDPYELFGRESLRIEIADTNRAPIALPGSSLWAPTRSEVILDGCASEDPDGDPVTYRWTDRRGNELGTECQLTREGPWWPRLERFELTVDDGELQDSEIVYVLWLSSFWIELHERLSAHLMKSSGGS